MTVPLLKNLILLAVFGAGSGGLGAQTLTDLGAAAPTPGIYDIAQLSTNGNQAAPDGLNYYTDNQSAHNAGEPGQTFTTGSGSAGYLLTSVAFKSGGLGSDSGIGTAQPYYLHLYSVSGGTMVAQPLSCTSANLAITDGDWLQWSGLAVPLAPNTMYAWSFGVVGTASWEAMAVTSSNLYAGGEIGLIPTGGGAITFGGSHKFDAVFDLGLSTNTSLLFAGLPIVSPALTNFLGSPVTLTAFATGAAPLHYQWQMAGGSGALTNLPAATNVTLTLTPPATGTCKFNFLVTNPAGSVTSSVVVVTIIPPVAVTVNVAKPLAMMPLQGLGVCTAVYDNSLISGTIAPLLKAAGIGALRFPGGSYADIFNWQTTTGNDGGYVNTSDSFDNFMNTDVNPAGAQAIVTVNYGSNPADTGGGDPNVAAAWVAHANVTNHWGVVYWEIGNEVGGNGYYGTTQDWEYDLHYPETNAATRVGQPALSPAAYGTNALQFISAMKARDSTIKCGVGFDTGDSTYNTQLLGVCGASVDFVIIHYYPGDDAPSLLAASTGIVGTVQNTFTQLTNDVGAAHAAQMKILVTETGAGNVTGAPVSLFAADNYLTWIENGVVNVDYQILHNDLLTSGQGPGHAYYGAQMAHLLANVGDTFLQTTSGLSSLRVHATSRQDGKTGLMLINLSPTLAAVVTATISNGPALAAAGTCYQFGLTNFIGANDYPSYPVATNTVSGLSNTFSVLVPPYTILDLLIPSAPTNTPPVLAALAGRTVNVGSNLVITATVTDTNVPAPTLTFSLLSGPTNAALAQINNTNASLSWRPLVTQSGTTNAFALKVADNYTPSLGATQKFTVTVNPLLPTAATAVTWTNGRLGFQISGQTGPDYAVEASSNLLNWNTVFLTNSPAMPFQWATTNLLAAPAQFYRIQAGPPLPDPISQ